MNHLSLSVLLICGAAAAQTFTITQSAGGDNFGARSTGQTFTPGIGVMPATTLPALPLTQITLYAGNSGANAPSATTYLNLYDGDPNAGGAFVGSSTNSLDTNGLTFRSPLVWDFPQIPLLTSIEYWAVMSSTNTAGTLDVAASLETEPRNGPPGPNIYTGGAGLIANIVPHPNSVDAKFDITFLIGVPGSFIPGMGGCAGSGGIMQLSSPGVPRLGQGFQVDVANIGAGAIAFGVLGFSDTTWNGAPLPVPLGGIVPGANPMCLIEISPDDAIPLAVSGSTASLVLPMPSAAGLAGFPFFLQAAQFELSGLSLSAKASAILGN